MKRVVIIIMLGCTSFVHSFNSNRISKQEYVERWNEIAVDQMVKYKIPASITLAQAILESANGNSTLAVKGNNHFGIKCHGWEGKKMYKDDDRENECFRVYKSAEESFVDHSLFLTKYNRYAFLFDFKTTDYVAWAKGLKKAGYATNPKYPQLLIDIIEDMELYRYDNVLEPIKSPLATSASVNSMMANTHEKYMHDKGVPFVVAKKGDTFYKISKEFNLSLNQLYRFNDFDAKKDILDEGDIVYIKSKKRGSIFHNEEIEVNETITVTDFAQKHATYEKSIRRLNNLSEQTKVIAKGEKVTLR